MSSVSVVIPHYGDPAPTQHLVGTLMQQLGPDDEVIVSDDCSPVPFPDRDGVTVVRRARNGGFGSAVNSGVRAACGDLILILNSDLDVEADFVADLVAAAAPWQPCVAAPKLIEPYGVSVSARHFTTTSHVVAEWLAPLARFQDRTRMLEAMGQSAGLVRSGSSGLTDWLVGAALLIPRADFLAVGGFDEAFYMNMEEVDLQRRLRDRGLQVVYLPQVEVRHAGGGSSDPERRGRWLLDGRKIYGRKWGEMRLLRPALSAATAVNLVWNTGRRIAGRRDVTPVRTARAEWKLIWGEPRRD